MPTGLGRPLPQQSRALYYASGVLRDGRVIVAGGEYDSGVLVMLLNVERYDPVADTWTTLPNPSGWARIGDAPGCVLPDGRFIVGQVGTRNTAIYDPSTNAWTAAADKINTVGEESWSLLPDGTIHAVDCSNPPNAEKYIIASDQWVAAGATPQVSSTRSPKSARRHCCRTAGYSSSAQPVSLRCTLRRPSPTSLERGRKAHQFPPSTRISLSARSMHPAACFPTETCSSRRRRLQSLLRSSRPRSSSNTTR